MKNVLTKVFATILIFLISGFVSLAYSGEWIEKIVVDKEFEINKGAELIIDHEFGNVRCENWDRDYISILATVRVKTKNSEKAAQIIDNIVIAVKGNRNKVEAVCDLNQKYRNNKTSVNIDFDIKMPATINLNLESKFGSVYVESVSGTANISSEYGSLEIISLDNRTNNIEIGFGDGKIKHIANGSIEVGYSHFSIGAAEELSIETEYSDINIGKAKTISLELEGGNATIGDVTDFEVESSFANIEIQSVSGSLTGETQYGSLNVSKIMTGFSVINLVNEFGALTFNVEKGASYKINADGKYCSIDYPGGEAKISYSNKSNSSTVIKGVVGKETDPKSSISVRSEYGAVNIQTTK